MRIRRLGVIAGVLVGLLVLFGQPLAHAQNTQNFIINDFTQTYALDKSSSNVSTAKVNEYITATFPNFNQNHGILRALPQDYNNLSLHLADIAVNNATFGTTTPDQPISYASSNDNGNTLLKIGDASTYVQGVQHYHISYSMQNVIRTYNDHDELYINVNGTQWQQSMQSVTSIITMPKTLGDSVKQHICYSGEQGSLATKCQTTASSTATTSEFRTTTSQPLSAGQNLSVVLWFPKGTFVVLGPTLWQKLWPLIAVGASLALPIIVTILLFRQWLKYGRDPKGRGTIVPQYEPYTGLDVLSSGVILKQTSNPSAITAQIIDLAIRGYIRIIDLSEAKDDKPKDADYKLEKLKEPTDLPADQQTIINTLFTFGDYVELSALKNTLHKESAALGKSVEQNLVATGYYKAPPSKQRSKYISIGLGLIFIGFFLMAFVIGFGIIASGIMFVIFGTIMPARTLKGVEANEYLLGLKEYVGLAEQDRLKFHQSANNAERKRVALDDARQKIHLYESLLPYAMLFGMEKSWSSQFASLYTAPPTWYQGNAAFNAIYFTNTLGSFSSATNASFSAPSSSGGSGFSGGGSGGGGGGGGGGGW